jgi:hypothetical protein
MEADLEMVGLNQLELSRAKNFHPTTCFRTFVRRLFESIGTS